MSQRTHLNWAYRDQICSAIFAGVGSVAIPQVCESEFYIDCAKTLKNNSLRIHFKSLSSRGLALRVVSDGDSAAVRLTPAMEIC
jgi:hypothetical protein